MAIEREIHPVRGEKGRSIRMLLNGIGSKMDEQAKVGKARAKAKGKERKVATATEGANLCATIGARGTGTAGMLPPELLS